MARKYSTKKKDTKSFWLMYNTLVVFVLVVTVNGNGNTIRANFTAHAHYVFLRCCTVHVSVCVLAWDPLSLKASRIFNSLVPDHTTPTYARWKYGWLGSTLALFTPFRYGDVPVAMVITCVPSRRDFDLILQGVWQPSSLIPLLLVRLRARGWIIAVGVVLTASNNNKMASLAKKSRNLFNFVHKNWVNFLLLSYCRHDYVPELLPMSALAASVVLRHIRTPFCFGLYKFLINRSFSGWGTHK